MTKLLRSLRLPQSLHLYLHGTPRADLDQMYYPGIEHKDHILLRTTIKKLMSQENPIDFILYDRDDTVEEVNAELQYMKELDELKKITPSNGFLFYSYSRF